MFHGLLAGTELQSRIWSKTKKVVFLKGAAGDHGLSERYIGLGKLLENWQKCLAGE
jgi:hypothetical protein